MIRRPIQRSTAILLGVLAVAVLLGAYTWLSWRVHQERPEDTTMPGWSQLAKGVSQMVSAHPRTGERWLLEDAKASGYRFFVGLGMGLVGALLIGMMMGCLPAVEAVLYPPLSLFAKVPATAALAIFFVVFGTDQRMFTSMIVFGVTPTLALSVMFAVKEFPEELQFKAYTLGASHMEVLWAVIFRSVLPKLIDATRLVIGPAMIALIGAELYVGDPGFGYRIRLLSKQQNMSVVYPYLALLAGFGFSMDYGLKLLQKKLCPWYEGSK